MDRNMDGNMDGRRVQLHANCKFLYGPDVEIVTLRHNISLKDGRKWEVCQAVAMRFDTFTSSWTKFLTHTEGESEATHAITSLLRETELEIGKRFDVNGVGVPFIDHNMVQHMTLHRREESLSTTSSVTVDTPASSEADKDLVEELVLDSEWKTGAELLREKNEILAPEPEAGPEIAVETVDEFDWGVSKKKKKDKKKLQWGDIPPYPEVDMNIEPVQEVELWDFSSFTKTKKGNKSTEFTFGETSPADIPSEPKDDISAPPPAPTDAPVDDFDWDFTPKKKKKGKKSTGFNFSEAVVDETPVEPNAEDIPVPQPEEPKSIDEPAKEYDPWAEFLFLKAEAVKITTSPTGAVANFSAQEPEAVIEQPIEDPPQIEEASIPAPEPEKLADDDDWGLWGMPTSKKSKKNKCKMTVDEECQPSEPIQEETVAEAPEPAAPEPEPEVVDDYWGSGWPPSNMKKKGKGKKVDFEEDCAAEELVAEEAIVEEPCVEEPCVEEAPPADLERELEDEWASSAASNKIKKKKKSVRVEEECPSPPEPLTPVIPFDEPPLPAAVELESNALSDDWGSFVPKKSKKCKSCKKKSIAVEEAKASLPEDSKPEPEPEVGFDVWGFKVDKKEKMCKKCEKRRKKSMEVEEPSQPEPEQEPEVVSDGWGSFMSKKKKSKKSIEVEVEEPSPPEPEPEPEIVSDGWGSFATKKDKKKKGKMAIVEECLPPPTEPETTPGFCIGWGTSWISNLEVDKKAVEEECPVVEEECPIVEECLPAEEECPAVEDCPPAEEEIPPPPPPQPEPEAIEGEFGWGSSKHKGDKKDNKTEKKKKGNNVIVEEVIIEDDCPPPAEEVVDDLGWGPFSSKKDKKKKGKTAEEVVEDFGWGSFSNSKNDKKKKGKNAIVEDVVIEEPILVPVIEEVKDYVVDNSVPEDCQPAEKPLVELAPEIEEPTTATPIIQEISLKGYTVILKILHTSNTSEQQTLGTMVKLDTNTRKAILSAVTSYLDSITPGTQRGKRTLDITHGKGKDGDLKLSGLDEDMWPEYLDYFRSYWTFPEFVVRVVDE